MLAVQMGHVVLLLKNMVLLLKNTKFSELVNFQVDTYQHTVGLILVLI